MRQGSYPPQLLPHDAVQLPPLEELVRAVRVRVDGDDAGRGAELRRDALRHKAVVDRGCRGSSGTT